MSISDFEMIQIIGEGSFGKVWLALDKKDKNYFAIKKLSKSEIIKNKQQEHIMSEMIIASTIKYKFLV